MKLRRGIALVPSLLILIACADTPIGSGNGDSIDHATDPESVLVRVSYEGGFVPVDWTFRNLPVFSLYGDGTVVLPGAQIEIYPGPALPAISRRSVEEPGIQAILEEALEAIRDLPDDLGDMGSVAIADAATTVITVEAGGVDRRVEVYALSELDGRPDGMPEDVYRARRRLAELVNRLGSLDWLPAGSLGPETPYAADSACLFVSEYRKVDDLRQDQVAWPLATPLETFGEPTATEPYRCGTVSGEEWITLRDMAASANELTPWTDGGSRYSILFRPMLPDESSC